MKYILDANGEPQRCDDIDTWGRWHEAAWKDRSIVVAHDKDESGENTILISTVFLGLDHAFGSGPPILWETLVFGGLLDGEMNRYASRDAAFRGHQEMCARVSDTLHRS